MFQSNIGNQFQLAKIVDSTSNYIDLDFTSSDITIIDFWNNSCPPCIAEMKQFPDLIKGKANKIKIVSISVNQYWLWKKTLEEHIGTFSFLKYKLDNWKQYNLFTTENQGLKNDFSNDRIVELQKIYGIVTFPAYFVVDKNGIILSRPESAVDFLKNYE